jgi:hypothetical protein
LLVFGTFILSLFSTAISFRGLANGMVGVAGTKRERMGGVRSEEGKGVIQEDMYSSPLKYIIV